MHWGKIIGCEQWKLLCSDVRNHGTNLATNHFQIFFKNGLIWPNRNVYLSAKLFDSQSFIYLHQTMYLLSCFNISADGRFLYMFINFKWCSFFLQVAVLAKDPESLYHVHKLLSAFQWFQNKFCSVLGKVKADSLFIIFCHEKMGHSGKIK